MFALHKAAAAALGWEGLESSCVPTAVSVVSPAYIHRMIAFGFTMISPCMLKHTYSIFIHGYTSGRWVLPE